MFDQMADRVNAGERLTAADITALAAAPEILPIGMLADAVKRRLHGDRVTYLRVATCPLDGSFAEAVPPAAREVRITGTPDSVAIVLSAVESARAIAGDRVVSGVAWRDVERLAASDGTDVPTLLRRLRSAGLDMLAPVPLDETDSLAGILDHLNGAGFPVRVGIADAAAADRTALFVDVAALQAQYGCIQAIDPLPMRLHAARPTTGYEDVKMVAVARIAAANVPTIQVDWTRYGPKLAQVALTFGADDLDGVPASDEAPEGRRRAPLEEVRRNIQAAGFAPAERDGRFAVVA